MFQNSYRFGKSVIIIEKLAYIAMSGGVDSSVSAYLIQQAGYVCHGVTMRLYRNMDIGLSQYHTCCSQKDIDDAADVAFTLDIPFEVIDYTACFKKEVMDRFVAVYEKGGTPNPCIDCNRYMKFDRLLEEALSHGAQCLVTGHYARIQKSDKTGRYLLKKAMDPAKDQSYVLYMLTQHQLAHLLLPLGELTKSQVRAIAASQGFDNAAKHDSQDICFVPDGDYAAFMERHTGKHYPPGHFIDKEGHVLGQHRGAVRYTLGQRKGLNLAMGHPVYVCAKQMDTNTVIIGEEDDLFTTHLVANRLNWIPFDNLPGQMRVTACTRYHQKEQPATATLNDDGDLVLTFDQPQRAVTPGQSVVLYDGETVLGGGIIREAYS